jgi:hypothetical protein
MNWVIDPEPAAYPFATLDLKLTKKQSMSLMSWVDVTTNNSTLLAPLNVKAFFELIDAGNYTEI